MQECKRQLVRETVCTELPVSLIIILIIIIVVVIVVVIIVVGGDFNMMISE